jgi:hypothetical protein
MKKKSEPQVGATVKLKVQSGTVEGRVLLVWTEKSTVMVRIVSGNLVYNVPVSMLVIDKGKSK